MIELFPKEKKVGIFIGFKEGGLEFHANLTLPYKSEFQSIPMIGQFLLIQLEHEDEAVLGRISSLSSEGKLASTIGENYNIRAMQEEREIPEDLREQYLKYRVNIRVLGVVRLDRRNNKLTFVASHRRLPHVGSPIAFPSDEVLKEIAGSNNEGAEIGYFSLGEFIYCGNSEKIQKIDWMQIKEPEVPIKFPITNLVARRSFIFARAGFGKSNLNKLLFSELYRTTPTISDKTGLKSRPVGTVIFDPDGEYFWPDNKKRPGLCDVEHLTDQLVVFTNQEPPSPYYGSFVVGGVKLDIRKFKPSDVITLALPEEKQDQQNVNKLKGMSIQKWKELVNLIDKHGYNANNNDIKRVMGIDIQEVEINAIKSNMTKIVSTLHDSSNTLFDTLKKALSDGKLCIIDMSQMRGKSALILSSIIVRNIFNHNAEEFTKKDSRAIPTLLVIEEAQSILNSKESASEPFVEWVKEGRKYDLGALMITQQPGSISTELLSQGDNWFIMHLLSAADLQTVKSANAHFSNDILSILLNEAIPGQGVFWSSVNSKPYPVSFRILSFENLYEMYDKDYNLEAIKNYATELREKINSQPTFDDLRDYIINEVKKHDTFINKIHSNEGISWGQITKIIESYFPNDYVGDKYQEAYYMVPNVLDSCFPGSWKSYENEAKNKVYVRVNYTRSQ
ncbi:DUF87 domain-containing protein [Hydrogenimonas thermophila]|uniref:ATP-binding protein n=1 Tax=Hydrogenimonas thermophila TaxID=223786 RepID=UPI0029371B47|nr:DUF87 domain-containing protein [Hydrogenimonas thermophila]WOE71411.1 DUF87 domain-containing protein [Hydrogenimonas thermophila]